MTMSSVQAVLDDLIRPALQSDGGDCTLLKVEDDNVYLQLIGACHGCPSSTITLRMGIETVLKEEFPQMNELIQVEHSF
ncbi:MAG: NifU family protein [Deltaproteobacteria bacterium]|nr:MAG: NifU family protein [Deltaproteobacteria bacterium]